MMNCITVKETHEFDFNDLLYHCWGGAIAVLEEIEKHGVEDEFISFVYDCFCEEESIELSTLNDFIWFEDETIFEALGIEWGVYDDDLDDDEDEDDCEDEEKEGDEENEDNV